MTVVQLIVGSLNWISPNFYTM